eukprot:gene10929-13386_t
MSESSELPSAIVNRIIKASLPDNVLIAKESKLALTKAAKVWIHYLTASSNDFCQSAQRTKILGKDVTQSLEELDFPQFIKPLDDFLNSTKKKEKEKEREKEKEKEKEKDNSNSSKDK